MRHPIFPEREYQGGFEADALLALPVEFEPDQVPIITEAGEILPPVEFSREQLEAFARLASHQPGLFDDDEATHLAKSLVPRITFTEELGCWELPLKASYDEQGRARYPAAHITALGINNSGAHRATLRFIRKEEVEGRAVDHMCRNHACCNPYHSEAVSGAENNRRGFLSRRLEGGQIPLWHPPEGITYGELARLATRSTAG